MNIQVNDFRWEPGKNDAEYIRLLESSRDEWQKIAQKAIAKLKTLSKAREPRVMTLCEVEKMAADFQDSMLWFEPKELDDYMWFMAYAQPVMSDEIDIHIYEFGNEQPIEAKKYLYGKTWRCWTSRPDEKRRAETPWE